jgi:carboxymethylenebutenolidase
MKITTREAELRVDGRPMRTVVVSPKASGRYPGILLYSEIFQLTGPIRRSMERLAGHGFVVAGPEIYHRLEPAGLVIPYDDAGRIRGQDDAARTSIAEFDADCRAALDYFGRDPRVLPGALGVAGFCIGGHLAFRGALQPDVRATVACYPTGVHNGKLGKDAHAYIATVEPFHGNTVAVYTREKNATLSEGCWKRHVLDHFGDPNDRGEGPGHQYLVQHSAGSGKSNTIAWLAHGLMSLHGIDDRPVFDKVVVITDRVILDRQLQETIYQFEHATGVVARIDQDSAQLAAALAVDRGDGVCAACGIQCRREDRVEWRIQR